MRDVNPKCVFHFSKSVLTLQQWLLSLYLWAREYPVTDVFEQAKVDVQPLTSSCVFEKQ